MASTDDNASSKSSKKDAFWSRKKPLGTINCNHSFLRSISMNPFVMTGTACLTRYRKPFLHLHRIMCAPGLLIANSSKTRPWCTWMGYLVSVQTFHVIFYSCLFLFEISQQYNAWSRKQLERMFHPVLPEKPWRRIFLISNDNIGPAWIVQDSNF